MNNYIHNILQHTDSIIREKQVQNTIVSLIKKYCKNPEDKIYLQYIKEVATYFKEQKINFSYNYDILLRTTCCYGETDFLKWLLKDANCKKVPDLLVETSKPLILATINNHIKLVEFLLTDKDIVKSDVNTVYGTLLSLVISQKNMKLVKLFLMQDNVDIKIEHINGIYQYNIYEQQHMLEFISNNSVKDKFFKTMVQYNSRLHNEIHDLLTKKYFTITEKVLETVKFSPEFHDLIEKREAYFSLDEKFPPKNHNQNSKKPKI